MNTFKYDICEALELDYGKTIQEASTVELYDAVSKAMMKAVAADWRKPYEGKQACYFSAEFLIGRLIYNNLLNLGLLDQLAELFNVNGIELSIFETSVQLKRLSRNHHLVTVVWDAWPPVSWIQLPHTTSR